MPQIRTIFGYDDSPNFVAIAFVIATMLITTIEVRWNSFLLQHLAALFPGRLASLVIKLSQVIHNLDHRVEADKVFERGGIYS
jgi:hypothetical protein